MRGLHRLSRGADLAHAEGLAAEEATAQQLGREARARDDGDNVDELLAERYVGAGPSTPASEGGDRGGLRGREGGLSGGQVSCKGG